MTRSGRRRFSL